MAWLQRDGVRLHFEVEGQGPRVLMIQGVGVGGAGWCKQVASLRTQFQILTFDNRGVGQSQPCRGGISIESMADDARALMDVVGWKDAHVVGHSMGGIIAQQLALDHPHRIRSLSLLCTFARGKDAARITPWVLWMTLRTRLGSRRMRRKAFLEMIWPQSALRDVDTDQLAHELEPYMGRDLADSPSVMMKQVRALARHDASAQLSKLQNIPVWVLSAGDDPIALPQFGRQLAKLIPQALYEEMPGASHAVILHDAHQVNQKLLSFLMRSEQVGATK